MPLATFPENLTEDSSQESLVNDDELENTYANQQELATEEKAPEDEDTKEADKELIYTLANQKISYGPLQKQNDNVKNSLYGKNKPNELPLNYSLLQKIYTERNFTPIWLKTNSFNDNLYKALEFIIRSEEHGLNKDDYHAQLIDEKINDINSHNIYKLELLISDAILRIIDNVANGVHNFESYNSESYFYQKRQKIDVLESFNKLISAKNVDEFNSLIEPDNLGYRNLKIALKKMYELQAHEKKNSKKNRKININSVIKPLTKDYQISFIRERLNVPAPINPKAAYEKDFYDKELVKVIKELQKNNNLQVDGIIGDKTIEILNRDTQYYIDIITKNMDRYRWLPREMPKRRIEVNIPEFMLYAYDGKGENADSNTKPTYKANAIVGREMKKTPIIHTVMNEVIFHPYWYVPRGYAAKYILPLIKADVNYLTDDEYTVIDNSTGKWQVIDPSQVNWNSITEENFNYILRQDPGKKNALGPIKFNIINDLSIYLHGTSEPWMFSNQYRANSSGCIRIDEPLNLAKFVLNDNSNYDTMNLDELYNLYTNDYDIPYDKKPKHYRINIENPIPVFVTYYTAIADEQGTVNWLNDIYDFDK